MPFARPELRLTARTTVAATITAAVAAVAAVAAALAAPTPSGPLVFVETVSAWISGGIFGIGARLALWYAVVAGMVASVNPCGFALLPAYLGLYLGGDRAAVSPARRVGRAVTISMTITASFVLLFAVVGILAGLAASGLASSLPWIGMAVGVALILTGGIMASGWQIKSPPSLRPGRRLRRAALGGGIGGYAAYGAAYALASLGCTLPVFLSVVATSFQLHGVFAAAGQFMLFGVGMGIVLTAVTIATAFVGRGLTRRLRALAPHAGWMTAVLMWLAGAYVLYYWLTAERLM
jgi:cytochrome c biogenesis protein CcdA